MIIYSKKVLKKWNPNNKKSMGNSNSPIVGMV